MDPLADVLADLRLESTLYARFAPAAPWAVAYPALGGAAFHVVTAGQCVLTLQDAEAGAIALPLTAGDFVVLPHGHPHVIADGTVPAVPVEALVPDRPSVVRSIELGGGGRRASYLCGACRYAAGRTPPPLRALPPVLLVRGDAGRMVPWLEQHLEFLACEASSGRPGSAMVLARLSDILFVQAIRAHLAELPVGQGGWLGALRDGAVGRALALMHHEPQRAWTVDALARAVAMSRSRFAARFAELVGRPPLAYLAEWRMHRAGSLLRDGHATVAEVAARLGYRSEAAFSHAFKRHVGVSPGAFRRAAASGSAGDGRPGPAAGASSAA